MKTTVLTGPALNWMALKALGYMPAKWEKRQWGRELVLAPEREFSNQLIKVPDGYPLTSRAGFEPSTNWSQGGPIVDRENINITGPRSRRVAQIIDADGFNFIGVASTSLIAAMRCFVASKLGDKVDVPKELM